MTGHLPDSHLPRKIKYLYTYKTLITLFVCMFDAVRTNPGYGMAALISNKMAALISNNLLNLIFGTVILLRSS